MMRLGIVRTGTFAPVECECSRRDGTYTHDVDACTVVAEVDCGGLPDGARVITLPPSLPPLDGEARSLVARGGALRGRLEYAVAPEPVRERVAVDIAVEEPAPVDTVDSLRAELAALAARLAALEAP